MARLTARGKYLFDGERKFFARGVSYGTFAPNSRGEPFPEPERVSGDFSLMRELGANVVRTYEPPPLWMIEQAASFGLRVMVGIPWASHLAFLDSRSLIRQTRDTIARTVTGLRGFGESVFAYALGNEIRSDIVRWHGPKAIGRFLNELRDLGKQLDPEGLFTYANYPSTEYLDLSFLDFVAFNVYLHREQDFRRYLTHVMGLNQELPLVLSETGIDTIREGEESQAELIGWQSRAVFEMGLSGLILFAFTDEWYRGGSEILDWAFGLVTRERVPKPAFRAAAEVFKGELPPPLRSAPKASVVVAAYNAERTLGECLSSLADLNYPDYETIVVDDGSTDSTAKVAERAAIRLVRRDHLGLGAARNAGLDAAQGELVAFIDADARADRDWLYHLAEAATRRQAAVGGPNLPPPARSSMEAAIAGAPGQPREVRLGDDGLAQLCGCNMAVDKSTLKAIGGFDPMFAIAGDDVDLSWRLRDAGAVLAAAPGAIVFHSRRPDVSGYLAQQRGYGVAEGLLFRKHPARTLAGDGVYGGPRRLSRLFSQRRIYYGAFGRGLFQSLYPTNGPDGLQVPLSIEWVAGSLALVGIGLLVARIGIIGWAGLAASMGCAVLMAATGSLDRARSGPLTRALLTALCFLGPLARSIARERVRLTFEPRPRSLPDEPVTSFRMRGDIALVASRSDLGAIAAKPLLAAMRAALVRDGIAVASSDGFQSFDLELVIPPAIRVPINAVDEDCGRISLRWHVEPEGRPIALCACALALLLLLGGASWWVAASVMLFAGAAFVVISGSRTAFIPAILAACADEAGGPLGLRVAVGREGAEQPR